MTANELAEDLEGAKLVILRLNDMLRQQQAEIEALKADNGHYRDMAVDFLKCREPYGWHCFIGEQDFLFVNGKGASMPDSSWDKVLSLYLHPSIQEQKDEQ